MDKRIRMRRKRANINTAENTPTHPHKTSNKIQERSM